MNNIIRIFQDVKNEKDTYTSTISNISLSDSLCILHPKSLIYKAAKDITNDNFYSYPSPTFYSLNPSETDFYVSRKREPLRGVLHCFQVTKNIRLINFGETETIRNLFSGNDKLRFYKEEFEVLRKEVIPWFKYKFDGQVFKTISYIENVVSDIYKESKKNQGIFLTDRYKSASRKLFEEMFNLAYVYNDKDLVLRRSMDKLDDIIVKVLAKSKDTFSGSFSGVIGYYAPKVSGFHSEICIFNNSEEYNLKRVVSNPLDVGFVTWKLNKEGIVKNIFCEFFGGTITCKNYNYTTMSFLNGWYAVWNYLKTTPGVKVKTVKGELIPVCDGFVNMFLNIYPYLKQFDNFKKFQVPRESQNHDDLIFRYTKNTVKRIYEDINRKPYVDPKGAVHKWDFACDSKESVSRFNHGSLHLMVKFRVAVMNMNKYNVLSKLLGINNIKDEEIRVRCKLMFAIAPMFAAILRVNEDIPIDCGNGMKISGNTRFKMVLNNKNSLLKEWFPHIFLNIMNDLFQKRNFEVNTTWMSCASFLRAFIFNKIFFKPVHRKNLEVLVLVEKLVFGFLLYIGDVNDYKLGNPFTEQMLAINTHTSLPHFLEHCRGGYSEILDRSLYEYVYKGINNWKYILLDEYFICYQKLGILTDTNDIDKIKSEILGTVGTRKLKNTCYKYFFKILDSYISQSYIDMSFRKEFCRLSNNFKYIYGKLFDNLQN